MNPRLRRSTAHVVVESLTAPALSDDDAHHLGRVLRVRPTDEITVTDGRGSWAPAHWSPATGVELTAALVTEPRPSPVGVVSAIPKGDRPEWIVQKLTELGVDRIAFVALTRAVVQWDEGKVERQVVRLVRIAREAVMQSRRVWMPSVAVTRWSDLLGEAGLALAEPGGAPVDATVSTVVIGPEGGFTDDELAAVPRTVGLSSQVLRVETAALTAAVLLRLQHGTDLTQGHG